MLQNAHNHYFTAVTVDNLAKAAGFRTLYVDDEIRTVLQPHDYDQSKKLEFISDYPDIVNFIRHVEQERLNHRPHQSVKRKLRKIIIRILRTLKLYDFVQKMYYKIIY